jgi:hypothetical protein
MSVKDNLNGLKKFIPDNCTIVAVSKTKPNEDIMEAYHSGHRDFGENKVQELTRKAEELPDDIKWHMIGHLQRNKVKYIAPFIHLIHSVDSLRLVREINKQGEKYGRVISCLLQIHIAEEETKFGLNDEELSELVDHLEGLAHIQIIGLMGMATFTENKEQVRKEFNKLMSLFKSYKSRETANFKMNELSIGMSNDYKIALEMGSSMVRIGSTIFGARNY